MQVPSETLLSSLQETVRTVLETMFFSTAEPVECCHGNPSIAARLAFRGDPSGELVVTVSHDLAQALAAGFLGVDFEEVTAEAERNIVCELANMICGAVLSHLHPDAVVALDSPHCAEPDFPAGGAHQCFAAPEGMLAVTMSIR